MLDAYGAFSPELADVGGASSTRPGSTRRLRPGKAAGAFAHPTVPSAHPYLLLNYHGRTRDVMTLAHELGHGVHQVLAARAGLPDGRHAADAGRDRLRVRRDADLPRAAGSRETESDAPAILLAGKVEDMLNTVVRQIAFYDFETRLHDERREGELPPDAIGEIWLEVQTESLGPAFEFDAEYKRLLVLHPALHPLAVLRLRLCLRRLPGELALFGLPGRPSGLPGEVSRHAAAGGTKRHKELLAPFGLDASDPAFWDKGLGVIAGFIDELERAD